MVKKFPPPKKRDPIRVDVAKTGRGLPYVQRLAIEALLASTTKRHARAKLKERGVDIDAATLERWVRSPRFKEALQARANQIAASITKSSVVVNAANLLEEAMKPRPILHRGEDTGFTEIELGAALTANEQLGKALGAFQQDEAGRTVIVLDIDFSGRKNPVQEIVVEDGEFKEVEALPAPPDTSWLD